MKALVGTSGFQYPEWKGIFYPEKMPPGKMLPFYAERFCTTEINYSFRRIPNAETISKWADATPPEFKFSFKAPQKITHFARLRGCTDTLEYFSSVISHLEEKRGAVLFQLPPDFGKDVPRLSDFLETLPQHLPAAFEFRNDSWFDDAVFSTLQEHNVALCIAESEKLATPPVATADWGYLRLRRTDYTEVNLSNWADLVHEHESDWREVFIYFKHEESGIGPRFAEIMKEHLSIETSSIPGRLAPLSR